MLWAHFLLKDIDKDARRMALSIKSAYGAATGATSGGTTPAAPAAPKKPRKTPLRGGLDF